MTVIPAHAGIQRPASAGRMSPEQISTVQTAGVVDSCARYRSPLDSLNSQTKCNTFITRCCYGNQLQTHIGRQVYDCPSACRRAIAPANRCNFGLLAIDSLAGVEAQHRASGRVQTGLCRRTGLGAPMARQQIGTPTGPAKARSEPSCYGMVARANRRSAGAVKT